MLKVSHTGGPGGWRGLIKDGRDVVWSCPHNHGNRDQDTDKTAARPCAGLVLSALIDRNKFVADTDGLRRWAGLVHNAQHARHAMWSAQRRDWALAQADDLHAALWHPLSLHYRGDLCVVEAA